jgi:MFS family permease
MWRSFLELLVRAGPIRRLRLLSLAVLSSLQVALANGYCRASHTGGPSRLVVDRHYRLPHRDGQAFASPLYFALRVHPLAGTDRRRTSRTELLRPDICLSLLVVPLSMDMSFPAATVTMSDTLPPEQQGIAGSLGATVVNYSMSLGLGIASTAQYYVDDDGRDTLAVYRGASYVSIGLGGLGILIAVTFFIKDLLRDQRARYQAKGGRPSLRANRRPSRLWSQITLTPHEQLPPVHAQSLGAMKTVSFVSHSDSHPSNRH